MGDRLVLGTLGVGAVTTTLAVRREGEPVRVGKRLLPRFRADEEARARLFGEAEILRHLDGRGAPRLLEAGDDALGPFFVMERLPLPSLSEHSASTRPDRGPWVALASRATLHALATVHDADDAAGGGAIVPAPLSAHADDARCAALIDFGLSRWRGDLGAPPGTFRGTLAYAAPEVAQGQIANGRSDLFAL